MRLEAATVRNWLEDTDANRRLIDLVWAPWGEYVRTEAFRACHGQYDERLVFMYPLRVAISATDWPECRTAQVSVGFSILYDGQGAASFGARFSPDGVMTVGELSTMYLGIGTDWPLAIPAVQPRHDQRFDFSELREWTAAHNAEVRAINAFWTCIRSYRNDHPKRCRQVFGEARTELFSVAVSEVGLFLDPRRDEEYCMGVQVTIPVVYDGVRFGRYLVDFTLSGDDDDDWFLLPD